LISSFSFDDNVTAWKVLDNASDLASFGLVYDPNNTQTTQAKVIVNELNSSGRGPFWFEYKVGLQALELVEQLKAIVNCDLNIFCDFLSTVHRLMAKPSPVTD
jgi:hypothetical protein